MENPFEIIIERLDQIEKLLKSLKLENSNAQKNYPEIFTVKHVAEYLDVSKSYIYQLTRTNLIPHSKNGNRLYFDKEKITKWVLENNVLTHKEIKEEVDNYLTKSKYSQKNKY
jgi:excisionase family DNA binding protein